VTVFINRYYKNIINRGSLNLEGDDNFSKLASTKKSISAADDLHLSILAMVWLLIGEEIVVADSEDWAAMLIDD
jgi:hypothetical protein